MVALGFNLAPSPAMLKNIQLNDTQIHQITRFGILLESVLPKAYKDLTMPNVVKEVLSTNSTLPPVNLQELLTPPLEKLGMDVQPLPTTIKLNLFLENFALHDTLAGRLETVSYVFLAISFLFLCARIYAQVSILRQPRMYDWIICLAMVISIFVSGFCLVGCYHYGLGQHVYNVSFNEMIHSIKLIIASTYVVQPGTFCVKWSMTMWFMTLVPRQRKYKFTGIGAILLISLLMITGIFVAAFQCKPIDYWNNSLQTKCLPRGTMFAVRFLTQTLTDLVVLVISIPVVWKQTLNIREKIVVGFLYAIAGVCVAATIVRLESLRDFVNLPDKTFNIIPAMIWTIVEINLAIIIACIPLLKSIFLKHAPGLLGYDRHSADVALTQLRGRSFVDERKLSETELQSRHKASVAEDGDDA